MTLPYDGRWSGIPAEPGDLDREDEASSARPVSRDVLINRLVTDAESIAGWHIDNGDLAAAGVVPTFRLRLAEVLLEQIFGLRGVDPTPWTVHEQDEATAVVVVYAVQSSSEPIDDEVVARISSLLSRCPNREKIRAIFNGGRSLPEEYDV